MDIYTYGWISHNAWYCWLQPKVETDCVLTGMHCTKCGHLDNNSWDKNLFRTWSTTSWSQPSEIILYLNIDLRHPFDLNFALATTNICLQWHAEYFQGIRELLFLMDHYFHLGAICHSIEFELWAVKPRMEYVSNETRLPHTINISNSNRNSPCKNSRVKLKCYDDISQSLCTICQVFNFAVVLTHWGRVTHICVSELTIIGSDNGLSPGRHQAII